MSIDDYEGTIAAQNPLSWWKLDETEGTTATDSGSAGHDGTYTGGFTLGEDGPVPRSKSVHLNGSTGYVTIADNDDYDLDDFTIVGIVKNDDASPTAETWISKRASASNFQYAGFYFNLTGITATVYNESDTAYEQAASGTGLAQNLWRVLAFTFADDELYLYVNGRQAGSDLTTSGTRRTSGTSPLDIGRIGDDSSYWDGNLCQIAIFTPSLSTATIAGQASALLTSSPLELVGELNRVAGTSGLEAAGAANVWAGTTGLEVVGALNAKAGTTGLELLGALRVIAAAQGVSTEGDACALLERLS